MEIPLDDAGNPLSQLASDLGGRRFLDYRQPDSSHLFQAFSPRVRAFSASFRRFVDQLRMVSNDLSVNGGEFPDELIADFKTLIYDATELFDFYTQTLPSHLFGSASHKPVRREYEAIAKRLRSRWAIICNKLKHDACQIAFTSGASDSGVAVSHGFMLVRATGGDALEIVAEVHPKPERRASFLKKTHELIHHILRVDYNAAKAVRQLPDDPRGTELKTQGIKYEVGDQLAWIASQTVFGYNEAPVFDGFKVLAESLELQKLRVSPLPGPAKIVTRHVSDGQSRTMPFA